MAIILDSKTGDVWDFVGDVWKKVRLGMRQTHLLRPRVADTTPHECSNPDCGTVFKGAAFRGNRTAKLYCTRFCRDEMSDGPTLESAAREVS